jgi:hypothetical protein
VEGIDVSVVGNRVPVAKQWIECLSLFSTVSILGVKHFMVVQAGIGAGFSEDGNLNTSCF